jgi:hypothetical protein
MGALGSAHHRARWWRCRRPVTRASAACRRHCPSSDRALIVSRACGETSSCTHPENPQAWCGGAISLEPPAEDPHPKPFALCVGRGAFDPGFSGHIWISAAGICPKLPRPTNATSCRCPLPNRDGSRLASILHCHAEERSISCSLPFQEFRRAPSPHAPMSSRRQEGSLPHRPLGNEACTSNTGGHIESSRLETRSLHSGRDDTWMTGGTVAAWLGKKGERDASPAGSE